MNIAKISNSPVDIYVPRDIKSDSTKQIFSKNEHSDKIKFNSWQQDILINALDKMINNVQLDNNHPLGKPENQALENYQDAMNVLSQLNSDLIRNYGSQAQANVSSTTFLQLVTEA